MEIIISLFNTFPSVPFIMHSPFDHEGVSSIVFVSSTASSEVGPSVPQIIAVSGNLSDSLCGHVAKT